MAREAIRTQVPVPEKFLGKKVARLGSGTSFGENGLQTDSVNRRGATVSVATDFALLIKLSRLDIQCESADGTPTAADVYAKDESDSESESDYAAPAPAPCEGEDAVAVVPQKPKRRWYFSSAASSFCASLSKTRDWGERTFA